MINHILDIYKSCTYDFRAHACSQDPLKDLFDEWVDYYRLKWAIAKVLQPASILEIGVRYGYSARAFLDAAPESQYLGLDADLPEFGGHIGALSWAKKSLTDFDVKVVKKNSQTLVKFPGGHYDLIHVDGQQDGDGTFHDLDLALNQGRYILIDGYFWSRENFLATNEWLWLNKVAIEWVVTIPGYAGEMLIKTSLKADISAQESATDSLPLANSYTDQYYLNDCGGYTEWRRSRGKVLGDTRLRAVADVAWALASPRRVLDLGAGRGELTFHFAKAGAAVTSIDYSKDAIALVEQTFDGESEARGRLKLVCGSVTDSALYEGNYDVALASDVIEHLAPAELEILYALVSKHLDTGAGILVVHTAPNLWNYRYEYPRQRRAAKQAGCWLPKQRRTFYERLMHINEQSPAVLKKQLRRHFPHVHLWFDGAGDLGGSLLRRYTIADMRRATSLYAMASHRPIDLNAIKAALRMDPLQADEAGKITIRVIEAPHQMGVGEQCTVKVIMHNGSKRLLSSRSPHPFHLSYHWEDETTGASVVFDGLRTQLLPPSRPDGDQGYEVMVRAPDMAGRYVLKVVSVQEMVRWHESANQARVTVEVIHPVGHANEAQD